MSEFDFQPSSPDELQATVTRLLNSRMGCETLGSMGLKLASAGLTFLAAVFLARLLGPSEYGVYAYVYALMSLLSVPSKFGLPVLMIRETARGMARQDYEIVQGIWRWAGRVTAIISLGLVGLTAIAIWFYQDLLAGRRLETFLWALVLVPLIALGDLRGAALRGLQRVVAGQLPEFLIRPGILALLLGGVALIGATITAPDAMALYVAASALAFVSGVWLLWRTTPAKVRHATPRFENRAWLASTLPLAFIGGMQLANQQSSILVQGFFLPDAQIGIYRVAVQVSTLASFGLVAVNTVVAPRFAALHVQGDMRGMQQLAKRSARVVLALNVFITIAFILAGRLFLQIAFGTSYDAAYFPLIIILIGQMVNSAAGSVGILLNMTGHEISTAKGMAVSAIANVVLNLLLVPKMGIIGSALATAVSLVIWNAVLWWVARRQLKINSMAFDWF